MRFELSDVIYTVNLTKDALERRIVLNGKEQKSGNFLWTTASMFLSGLLLGI